MWRWRTVYSLAQKITAKYGNDGYVLSRAIVPPQNLDPSGAIVTIEVIEGYVDKVEWPPSVARYPRLLLRLLGEDHRPAAGEYQDHHALPAAGG